MSDNHAQFGVKGATRRQLFIGTAAMAVATFAHSLWVYAKETLFPIHIKVSQILIKGKQALIDNSTLSKAVKEDKPATLDHLRELFGSLQPDQVFLDAEGRVVIANEDVAAKLQEHVEAQPEEEELKLRQKTLDWKCTNVGC